MRRHNGALLFIGVLFLLATLALVAKATMTGAMIPVVSPPTVNVFFPTPQHPTPDGLKAEVDKLATEVAPTPTDTPYPLPTAPAACPVAHGRCQWPPAPAPPSKPAAAPTAPPPPVCETPVPATVCEVPAIPTGSGLPAPPH